MRIILIARVSGCYATKEDESPLRGAVATGLLGALSWLVNAEVSTVYALQVRRKNPTLHTLNTVDFLEPSIPERVEMLGWAYKNLLQVLTEEELLPEWPTEIDNWALGGIAVEGVAPFIIPWDPPKHYTITEVFCIPPRPQLLRWGPNERF